MKILCWGPIKSKNKTIVNEWNIQFKWKTLPVFTLWGRGMNATFQFDFPFILILKRICNTVVQIKFSNDSKKYVVGFFKTKFLNFGPTISKCTGWNINYYPTFKGVNQGQI